MDGNQENGSNQWRYGTVWDSIPKRWQLIALLHTGFIIEYCLRVNGSVAVVEMKRQYGWTDYERGLMLSSFYWGYTFGQLPSNYIVQKTGAAKLTFACSIFFASFLTILLPLAANISFRTCLAVRACIGLAESAAFPAAYNMYPKWIPAHEQTVMITCIMSGLYLGEILCFLLSGYLVVSNVTVFELQIGGWVSVFWVFGMVGLLWVPVWVMCIYESPEDHPSISLDELAMLTSNRHKHELVDSGSTEGSDHSQSHNHSSYRMGNDIHSDVEMLVVRSAPNSSNGVAGLISGSSSNGEHDSNVTDHNISPTASPSSFSSIFPSSSSSSPLRRVTSGNILQGRHEIDPLKGFQCLEEGGGEGEDEGEDALSTPSNNTPWAAFFQHPASVTLLVCFWTQNWIGYLILSELPTYFTEQLGFGLKSAGLLSMAPYIAQFGSTLLFGFLFQWLQQNRNWSTRNVRQWAQHICFLGASGCLVLCGFVSEASVATCLMVAALAFYGSCQSGLACAFLDVSPRYSSTLNTVANVFGSLAGVMTPLVVSACTDRYSGVWGWRYVFLLTALQCVLSSILWYTYQTSSVVKVLNTPSVASKGFWESLLYDPEGLCALWTSCEVKQL